MSAATAKKDKTIVTLGRRKTASARVRMVEGTGQIMINGRTLENYCATEGMLKAIMSPLATVEASSQFDIEIRVIGGGLDGQAGAMRLGIARGLEKHNPEWRVDLKKAGHLKRDPRRRERKKAGQPGARKRFQFSKR